ncbi:hypothetical protein NFI96_002750, partial [Prochilodus magdalenae]
MRSVMRTELCMVMYDPTVTNDRIHCDVSITLPKDLANDVSPNDANDVLLHPQLVSFQDTIDCGQADLECSESESDGASADVGAGAVFAAVGSVLEEEDMDMDAVAEKNVFKAPSGKRKIKWTKPGDSKGKTQRVAGVRGEKQGDVLEVSSILGVDSGLISLDQEKAFDRVEHQYLWNTLEAFGFSPSFSAMVKVLYRDVESVLKINGGLSAPFKVERGIRQGCAMSGMLYCFAIEPLLNKLRSKIEGFVLPQYGVQHRLSAYADDVMIMVNGQLDVDNLVAAIRDFGKISSAKVNWQKSEAFAVGKWASGLPSLPAGVSWKRDGIKYLGVYLGDGATRQRNWDGVVEKMEGRLARWKWIRPQMSLRGRVLVINNLAASVLWHRLSCVDPPVGLLARLQAIMVDFFWDRLHWVAQGVLFQAKEEGGQGLVHLASRLATFRVQFIIKFLTGPVDLVWRKVASVILQKADGLRLDTALFLMDCKQLHLSGLPPFYRGLFKCWALFKTNRLRPSTSLFWLLEEPLLKGSRLDVVSGVPGLTQTLCKANMVKLQHLVDTAGPGLGDAQTVASFLGQRSVRQIRTVLDLWAKRLDREDWSLLQDYWSGSAVPNRGDPFPNTGLTPDFTDMSGPLLDLNGLRDINLGTAS